MKGSQVIIPLYEANKRYKDTLLISNNEPKADFEKYGQHHENG